MTKKSKCLLCNKEPEDDDEYNPWNTTYDRAQHLRKEHLFDIFRFGINSLLKTSFYNPDLAEIR
jgi:hypothetical protein